VKESSVDAAHKRWNDRQKRLRSLLESPEGSIEGIPFFLKQHAEVHSGEMSTYGSVSFEDEVLNGLTEKQIVDQPDRMEQSIAWILWHMARIEDVTMNMFVAGEEQLFTSDDWKSRVGVSIVHTGNAMSGDEIAFFSEQVNIDVLREYRLAVGQRTEAVVMNLSPEELHEKVSKDRLDRVLAIGAVVKEAQGVIDYWSRRTITGLLLMPPTRHCFIHLNHAMRIREQLLKKV
jgi:hypothetical protein